MPDLNPPTVTRATVTRRFVPDDADQRENGARPSVALTFERGDPLPDLGSTVVVSSATEGIFAWIREQTKAREDVLAAAIAWMDAVERETPKEGRNAFWLGEARALYDAVQRAKGDRGKAKPFPILVDRDALPTEAPSEDPQLDTARRVAEAVGGDREVTVIIVGDI